MALGSDNAPEPARKRRGLAKVAPVAISGKERFLGRIFTGLEVAFCRGRASELAARFAAKEAVMKALGVGLGAFGFHDVEVVNAPSGKPGLVLRGKAAALAADRGVRGWELSLTHTDRTAHAVAVAL